MFQLFNTTPLGRRGRIITSRGAIETPFFMPVATAGAMKGITHEELLSLGAEIMLCNTYHLSLRPGVEVIEQAGGLHSFIGWEKPILTDSGGYQVFSLRGQRKVTDEGAHFQSHIDGAPLFLGPKEAIQIQHALGADIIMCLDECPPSKASRREIEQAVDRTLRWAKVCKKTHAALNLKTSKPQNIETSKPKGCITNWQDARSTPLLFGIIQGGLHRDLRQKCLEEIIAIGFDGYALGGLAVGEGEDEMMDVVEEFASKLPKEYPRYLMGVGVPAQMRRCVAFGIDMFDSVLPMRLARHERLLLSDGSEITISHEKYKNDFSPIDSFSASPLSRRHTKSYLRHLLHAKERYGETIAIMQNLGVVLGAMKNLQRTLQK